MLSQSPVQVKPESSLALAILVCMMFISARRKSPTFFPSLLPFFPSLSFAFFTRCSLVAPDDDDALRIGGGGGCIGAYSSSSSSFSSSNPWSRLYLYIVGLPPREIRNKYMMWVDIDWR